MRRYVPVLGSFVLGAVSMFLLLGVQTSTVVQRSFAQATAPPTPSPSPYGGAFAELKKRFGVGAGFLMPNAMPTTPDIWLHMTGGGVNGGIQQLDGLDCNGCRISATLLTYAGGQFRCLGCSIASQNGVYLLGPAQNTFNMLRLVGVIPSPKPQEPNPSAPQQHTIQMNNSTGKLDWVSLDR